MMLLGEDATKVAGSRQNNIFLVVRPAGRLGNQLTTFSYLMAYCLEMGGSIVNPAFSEYRLLFEGTAHDTLCRFPCRSNNTSSELGREIFTALLKTIQKVDQKFTHRIGCIREGCLRDEPNATILKRHRYVIPTTWWLSDETSLRKHAHTIRNFFRPIAPIRKKLEQNQRAIQQRGGVSIGVHIRRSDYKTVVPSFYYDYDVYIHYMKEAASLFTHKDPVFFICSDEELPSHLFAEFNFVNFKQGAVEDMYTLASCDYIIGTKSSFNSWSSFIGDTPTYWIVGHNRPLVIEEFLRFAPGFLPQHAKSSLNGIQHPYFETSTR